MGHEKQESDKWKTVAPPMRWRTLAGFIILAVSLFFFLIDAYATILWGTDPGLQRPAWALLAVAVYFFFGVWIPMVMQQRRNGNS